MKKIDLFIIDPDPTFRTRLADIVENTNDLSVVFNAAGKQHAEITAQLEEASPDVLLMGINQSDSAEMDIFEEVRKKIPRLPIIILPLHSREGAKIALKTLKKGAVEYINKTSSETG
ncbi:MAG: response regulator, partial [Balneolaceae bacterium]|nr:response regulator [Balneolaceae bacterium]